MKILFLVFCFFSLPACSSTLCSKGKSKQGVLFDFDPVFKTVDIGSYPTFHIKDDWVKKLIVKWDGFLLVYGQKTVHCDNREEMKKNVYAACEGHKLVENHTIIRYSDDTGYEEWSYAPEEDWKDVQELDHVFKKKPDYHYENCRISLFGGLMMLLQTIIGI